MIGGPFYMKDQSDDSMSDDQVKHLKSKKTKKSFVVLVILFIVLMIGVLAGVSYLVYDALQVPATEPAQDSDTVLPIVDEPSDEVDNPVDNPIDFEELQAQNSEIYAWIYIPNTQVNYAVVQSATDDDYYLNHDAQGSYSLPAAIFSQSMNNTDFSDPVTVLYGHNGYGDSMFATLHYFENEEFFEENELFYIYTPGHILTYEVVSAYIYDDRHILNSFDFSNEAVLRNYLETIANPDSLVSSVRSGTELTVDSRVVQLSTCMTDPDQASSRYLVNGVLVDDQPTS